MSYSPIQSSGAGKIEQIRNSSVGQDFRREDHLDNSACMGELEGEYCKIRTCCARYWSTNKQYVRPVTNGFNECDKKTWLVDDSGQRERFNIEPMMTDRIDFANIRDMIRERKGETNE